MKWEFSVEGYEVKTLAIGSGEVEVIRPTNRTWWEAGLDEKSVWDRPVGLTRAIQYRNPARFKDLHRILAKTPKTHAGIRTFADEHGLLGLDDIGRDVLQEAGYSPSDDAELVCSWYGYIDLVKQVLDAHGSGKRVKGVSPMRIVNDLLRRYPAHMFLRNERDGLTLDFEPTSLFAAIMLSLARELAEVRRRYVCGNPQCRTVFWLKSGEKKRKYCTPNCGNRYRVAAHREGKRLACV